MFAMAMTFAKKYLLGYSLVLVSFFAFLAMWWHFIQVVGWDDLPPFPRALNDEPHLIRLWFLGNAGLAIPCFVIPFLLYFYVRLRPDDARLNRITLAFAVSFFLTGAVFSLQVYLLWVATFRVLIVFMALTALAWGVVAFAFGLWVITEARHSPGTRQLLDEAARLRSDAEIKDMLNEALKQELAASQAQREIDEQAATRLRARLVDRMEGIINELQQVAAGNEAHENTRH